MQNQKLETESSFLSLLSHDLFIINNNIHSTHFIKSLTNTFYMKKKGNQTNPQLFLFIIKLLLYPFNIRNENHSQVNTQIL
jgi:hypothetical protein